MTYGENSLTAAEIIATIDGAYEEDYTLEELLFQTGIDVEESNESLE